MLDLYAGTGRAGAGGAVARRAARGLRRARARRRWSPCGATCKELGLEDRADACVGADVCTALRRLAGAGERFSWVFLDPPYAKETEGVLAELSGGELLDAVRGGHRRARSPPSAARASVGGLFLTDRRQYGDTELSFFRCSGS